MSTLVVPISVGTDDGIFYASTLINAQGYLNIGCRDSGYNSYTFLRFNNVTIPPGASISAALIHGCSYGNYNGGTLANSTIFGGALDNALASNCDTAAHAEAVASTLATVTWSPVPDDTSHNWHDSPSIVSIIQEIVNRSGWSSGNSILIFLHNGTGDYPSQVPDNRNGCYGNRYLSSYDDDPSRATELHVTYGAANYNRTGSLSENIPVPTITANTPPVGILNVNIPIPTLNTLPGIYVSLNIPELTISATGVVPTPILALLTVPFPSLEAWSGIGADLKENIPSFSTINIRVGLRFTENIPTIEITSRGTVDFTKVSKGNFAEIIDEFIIFAHAYTGEKGTLSKNIGFPVISASGYPNSHATMSEDIIFFDIEASAEDLSRFTSTVLRYVHE